MNLPTLSQLFETEPRQWGLRGDPLLWRALATSLVSQSWPATAAEFEALLKQRFESLTGYPLSHQRDVQVESFGGGGMSGGHVSLAFWRETALPLLLSRYAEAK